MSTSVDSPDTVPDIDPWEFFDPRRSQRGEPTWEVACLHPQQGNWTESEYLRLDTVRIEFIDGVLDFLPTLTMGHQLIAAMLFRALDDYVNARRLGTTFFIGYPMRVRTGILCQPDVRFMRTDRPMLEEFSEGADLVMEVLSTGAENRDRDLVTKRSEYAAAGIPEYWIVDPEERTITVLTLAGAEYRVHGTFGLGSQATSALLNSFAVDVTVAD